jgi:hypothetical protein
MTTLTQSTAPFPATHAVDRLGELPASIRGLTEHDGSLYSSRPWLRIEEDLALEPPLYAYVDDADAAAFAALYYFDERSNPWPFARPDLFLQHQTDAPAPFTQLLPSYLIGGRRPGHSTFLYSGAQEQRRDALTRLIGGAAETATSRGAASLAALYCDSGDADLAAAFVAHGGVPVASFADSVLHLPGGGSEDWLASLPRKQRLKERADLRKLEAGEVRYTIAPLTLADIDWIVPLELDLYNRYGNDYLVAEARGLHRAYLDHLGPDALLLTAERGGSKIGFVSMIRSGDSAYLRQAGFDQERCEGAPVYFGALFHAAVEWAYANGVTTLDYSISTEDAKARRGCLPLGRTAWFVPLTSDAESALSA